MTWGSPAPMGTSFETRAGGWEEALPMESSSFTFCVPAVCVPAVSRHLYPGTELCAVLQVVGASDG